MSAESESSADFPQSADANAVDANAEGASAADAGGPGFARAEAAEPASPEPLAATSEPEVLSPEEMDCYECRACGYAYVPAKGDNRSNIAAGTAFQDLPLNWRCPVCSAPKKQFSNIGPIGAPSGFKENLNYGLGVNRLTPAQKNILIFGALAVGFLFFISLYGLR